MSMCRLVVSTVFSRLNAVGVYSKLDLVNLAFIKRGIFQHFCYPCFVVCNTLSALKLKRNVAQHK